MLITPLPMLLTQAEAVAETKVEGAVGIRAAAATRRTRRKSRQKMDAA
jgi:hypothetical protein